MSKADRTPLTATACILLTLFFIPGHASAQAQPASPRAATSLAELSDALETLATRVTPSVVQIYVSGFGVGDAKPEAGPNHLYRERSIGSGVIIDADGYIVTNAHVIEGATRVVVELATRRAGPQAPRSIVRTPGRRLGAQIVAIDEETDLALLKISETKLPVLPLGDSDAIKPGQIVLAFGSPQGLDSSVTLGVVSAVGRQLEPDDPLVYIQTDAPINPGSSGGPLVDVAGRLIGINTLIYSESGGHEGIGFALPSNIVSTVTDQLKKGGRVRRGDIGIRPQTITPTLAKGLKLGREWGVVLGDVEPGGPAEEAGLQVGDIVAKLNGKVMENGRQLQVNLYRYAVGEIVAIEVERGTVSRVFRVKVGERPGDPDRFTSLAQGDQHLLSTLGILALDLTPAVAALLPDLRQEQGGVVVAATSDDAPFSEQGGLRAGDVIYACNGTRIHSFDQLKKLAAAVHAGDSLVLQIEREGRLMYVSFDID